MNIEVLQQWLSDVSLPGNPSPATNPDGYWTVSVNGLNLTLAPDPVDDVFYLYAPVAGIGDEAPGEFYAELLAIQGEGRLPAGMMFGLEENAVVITGRFWASHFDAALLEKLLTDTMNALASLPDELADVMRALSEAYEANELITDDGLESAGEGGVSASAETADLADLDEGDAPETADADRLSDEELLRLQLMQDVRI